MSAVISWLLHEGYRYFHTLLTRSMASGSGIVKASRRAAQKGPYAPFFFDAQTMTRCSPCQMSSLVTGLPPSLEGLAPAALVTLPTPVVPNADADPSTCPPGSSVDVELVPVTPATSPAPTTPKDDTGPGSAGSLELIWPRKQKGVSARRRLGL